MKISYLRVLTLAVLLRLLWVIAVPVIPVFDCRFYDLLARNLAQGYGYSFAPGEFTAFWPVGPSFLYSIVYRVFGPHLVAASLFNVVVAVLGIWLAMRFAEIWFDRRIALLTGLLLAVWPEQIEFVTVVSSELVFNLFLLIWMVVWSSKARLLDRIWVRGTVMGAAAAATCFMRPIALLLPAVLLAVDLLRPRRLKRPVLTAGLSCLVMLALIAPWTLRNWRELHGFALISSNGGLNLYEGNHAGEIGDADMPVNSEEAIPEIERDRYAGDLARSYIREHPFVFAGRIVPKLYRLYSGENYGTYWNRPALLERYGHFGERSVRLASDVFWYAMLAMSLVGLNLIRRRTSLRDVLTHPCVMVCIYISCVYAITHAVDRFHFPCVPFLAMLAAVTLAQLWQGTVKQ